MSVSMTAHAIRETLAARQTVADRVFDDLYPFWAQRASNVHWTPVVVALRAATLLADRRKARLLDIGSGVGKFCIVAAAAFGARVRGIEQRAHLVGVATRAAARVGVDVAFDIGTLASCDPLAFNGVYLYNPYAENLCSFTDQIDETVELSEARYRRDVDATERFLAAARVGTKVVTYCGFGGRMPPEYALVLRERYGGMLELWEKLEPTRRRTQRPASPVSETRLRTDDGRRP
jgi:hypothetical protein